MTFGLDLVVSACCMLGGSSVEVRTHNFLYTGFNIAGQTPSRFWHAREVL